MPHAQRLEGNRHHTGPSTIAFRSARARWLEDLLPELLPLRTKTSQNKRQPSYNEMDHVIEI
jgi:hypothetical protein